MNGGVSVWMSEYTLAHTSQSTQHNQHSMINAA